MSSGIIFFDFEQEGPFHALFLDKMNALVLKAFKQGGSSGYKRVGVAKFLRTEKQRNVEGQLIVDWEKTWGPVRDGTPSVEVTIF